MSIFFFPVLYSEQPYPEFYYCQHLVHILLTPPSSSPSSIPAPDMAFCFHITTTFVFLFPNLEIPARRAEQPSHFGKAR